MKKIIFTTISIFIVNSVIYSQIGWNLQNSNTTNHLYTVQFLNLNTGYAAGQYGTILKTTNGGLTWSLQNSKTTNDLYKVFFIDINTGWAAGQNRTIVKTTNGGINYDTVSFGNYSFNDIYFADSNTGWAVWETYPNNVYKTINGGNTWQVVSSVNYGIRKILFVNSSTGYMNAGISYKTVNGGLNWTNITFGGDIGLQFFNLTTGYAITSGGYFVKTTNSGNNWTTNQIIDGNYTLYNAYFYDLNSGWMTGYWNDSSRGFVFKTFNGGTNWFEQNVGTNERIRAVNFVDANTGWIVGFNGIIYKTTNGGGDPIGIIKINNEIPDKFSLSQNYPNPFNPETRISFDIPKNTFVRLTIYNIEGKEIELLLNQYIKAGKYLINWNSTIYSSGVYFYKLDTDRYTKTKKMVILK